MRSFYIQCILTASLGGVLFGYDLGVIAGALPQLSAYFQLTPSQEERIVSLLYFGGGVGAASGGFLCDWLGRKFSIMFTDIMFGFGALLLCSAETVECVMVGRVVVGWAVAVSGIADVAYLHEISSVWTDGDTEIPAVDGGVDEENEATTHNRGEEQGNSNNDIDMGGRGSVVSVNEACISLGFLLAYGVAYGLQGDQSQENADRPGEPEAWRFMFAIGGLLATLQIIGMLFMPESPTWLYGKGRVEEADAASARIRGEVHTVRVRRGVSSVDTPSQRMNAGSDDFAPETSAYEVEDELQRQSRRSRFMELTLWIRSTPSRIKAGYREFMDDIWRPYKRQCVVVCFLASAQQFCGHPSVLNYSQELFVLLSYEGNEERTKSDEDAIELTVLIGILKFIATCIVIAFVEKGGRRMWLLTGASCILLSLTLLITAFIDHDEAIGSDNQQQSHHESLKCDLGIVGIYGVAVGYALSFGPLTWLITSELFDHDIRGRALGFSTIISYLAAGIVSNTFLSLQEGIGIAGVFMIYWIITLCSIVFAWVSVPNTGKGSPKQIEVDMNSMWMWGDRRRRCIFQRGSRKELPPTSEQIEASNCINYENRSMTLGRSDVNYSGLTPRRSSLLKAEIT